jgi:hypothetical protein
MRVKQLVELVYLGVYGFQSRLWRREDQKVRIQVQTPHNKVQKRQQSDSIIRDVSFSTWRQVNPQMW